MLQHHSVDEMLHIGFQNMTKQRHSNLPNHDTPVPGQTSKWQVLPERGKVFYCKVTARMFESVNLNLYKYKTLIYLTNQYNKLVLTKKYTMNTTLLML